MTILTRVPLLVLPVLLYNACGLLGVDLSATWFTLQWGAGDGIRVAAEHVCLMLAIVLLNVEVAKATSVRGGAIAEHVWSLLLALAVLVELIVVPFAQTVTFGLLWLSCVSDVASGIVVSIVSARRDMVLGSDVDPSHMTHHR